MPPQPLYRDGPASEIVRTVRKIESNAALQHGTRDLVPTNLGHAPVEHCERERIVEI